MRPHMPKLLRRSPALPLASLLISSVVLAGCGSGADGSTSSQPVDESCTSSHNVKFQVFEGSIINMQPLVAMEKGFLAKHCLTGTPVPLANTPAGISGTLTGTVDVLNTGPDNIIAARSEGVQMKILASLANREIYSLVVREELIGDSYKETLRNLLGGKVGVLVVGGSNEFHARAYFSDAGIDPTKVNYIAQGQTSTMLAGLENGQVDAVAFFGTAQDIATAKDYGVTVSDSRKPASADNPVPKTHQALAPTSLVWAAQKEWLKQNPEAATNWTAAMKEASKWVRDETNREELYKVMRDEIQVPSDVPDAERVYREMVDTYADMTSAELDQDAIPAWIDFTAKSRGLDITDNTEDIIWSAK